MISKLFTTLRSRVVLLGLVPATILAILLTSYLIRLQLSEIDRGFNERGELIAKQAATTSVYGVFTQDPGILTLTLNPILSQPEVLSIKVENQANEVLLVLKNTTLGEDQHTEVFVTQVEADFDAGDVGDFPDQMSDTTLEAPPLGRVMLTMDQGSLINKRNQIIFNSLSMMVIGLLITYVFAYLLSRSIIKPIDRLTDAVVKMKSGNLNVGVPVHSFIEIQQLEKAFNEMALEIHHTHLSMQAEIDQSTADLRETMEALEIQNVELDLAKKRAMLANEAKSQFLANMSHEIRTPMNGVIGYTQVLMNTSLTKDQKEIIHVIAKSANHLLGILNEILDYSKLESGKLELVNKPFNVINCCEEPLALYAPIAHEKGLEISLLIAPDVPEQLIGDESRIRQIFVNLISNAIKFTESGDIMLKVLRTAETLSTCSLVFSVSDTGIGIEEDELPRLFESFHQAKSTTKRKFGGTGLGLSICKKLVDSMQGNIIVHSRPGEGTEFRIELELEKIDEYDTNLSPRPFENRHCILINPHQLTITGLSYQLERLGLSVDVLEEKDLARVHVDYADLIILGYTHKEFEAHTTEPKPFEFLLPIKTPILIMASNGDQQHLEQTKPCPNCWMVSKPITQPVLTEIIHQMLQHQSKSGTAVLEAAPSSKPLRQYQLLVVDDNPINLSLMSRVLNEMGADVTEAGDGQDALEQVMQARFDLILMDEHMPGMNGSEVIERIREQEDATDHIPIVALTADILPSTQQQLQESGADAYLIKPVDLKELRKLLCELLQIEPSETGQGAASESTTNHSDNPELPIRDLKMQLEVTGGNEQLANDLFNRFMDQIIHEQDQIHALAEGCDWDQLTETLHRLKGGAAVCGVPAIHHVLIELELSSREQNETSLSKLLVQFDEATKALLAYRDNSGDNPALA